MRIGLDIDNVISDFDKTILEEFIKEDKNKRNKGIIDANARHITKGMFDWSKEEVSEFFSAKMETLAANLDVRENAKYFIDKLLEEGNEIYLISHRAYPDYKYPMETTVQWLEKNDINYTKLILSNAPDKSEECKKYNIDVMVDDRVSQCKKMEANGVKCIVMLTRYNYDDAKGMEIAFNWQDLYWRINEWKK